MYNKDTDTLFPARLVPVLLETGAETWKELLAQIAALEAQTADRAAFTLLMVRLCGCLNCQSDSYRGMRGCTACTQRVMQRYHGSKDDLAELYNQARQEVAAYLQKSIPS
jgi:hypothetical protein